MVAVDILLSTITSPTGPNGEVATAFATIENGVVTEMILLAVEVNTLELQQSQSLL